MKSKKIRKYRFESKSSIRISNKTDAEKHDFKYGFENKLEQPREKKGLSKKIIIVNSRITQGTKQDKDPSKQYNIIENNLPHSYKAICMKSKTNQEDHNTREEINIWQLKQTRFIKKHGNNNQVPDWEEIITEMLRLTIYK